MQRFFDRPDTRWRHPGGCLHLYALPASDAAVLDAFVDTSSALAAVPGVGAQPPEYLHVTVQRLDAFVHELDDERWAHAWATLEHALAERRPFELRFAPPRPGAHSVEAVAPATEDWHSLGGDVRDALLGADLGHVLTPPPYAPHYTVAYGVAPTPDDEIRAALDGTATTTSLTVDRLSLVAVDQDRDRGIFRFETLSEWRLGR